MEIRNEKDITEKINIKENTILNGNRKKLFKNNLEVLRRRGGAMTTMMALEYKIDKEERVVDNFNADNLVKLNQLEVLLLLRIY